MSAKGIESFFDLWALQWLNFECSTNVSRSSTWEAKLRPACIEQLIARWQIRVFGMKHQEREGVPIIPYSVGGSQTSNSDISGELSIPSHCADLYARSLLLF
jgi:hypothetical protein